MANIRCPQCGELSRLEFQGKERDNPMELRGLLTCFNNNERHRHPYKWPITIIGSSGGIITSTTQQLPLSESTKLKGNIPDGLKQDIEEAELACFFGLYKASAVMCRRALQLGLEEKLKMQDKTLGPLLDEMKKRIPPLFGDGAYQYSIRIKDYGDKGAHRTDGLDPKTLETIIHDIVRVLNELYCEPASQSG